MDNLDRIKSIVNSSYLREKVKCECIYITQDSPMNIEFEINSGSYANKNLIRVGVSSLVFDEDEYNIYVSTMASAIHEAYHYIHSNFFTYSSFIKVMTRKGMTEYASYNKSEAVFKYIAKTIGNCIEDGRIEHIACSENKRYKYFITNANKMIWEKRDMLKEQGSEFADFFHGLISLSVLDSLPKNFLGKYSKDDTIYKVLQGIYPLVQKGKYAPNFEECLYVCKEIFNQTIEYLLSIHKDTDTTSYEFEFTNNPPSKDAKKIEVTVKIDPSKIKNLPEKPSEENDGLSERDRIKIEIEIKEELSEKQDSDKQEKDKLRERDERRPLDIKSMKDILDKYKHSMEFHNTFEIKQDTEAAYISEGKKLRKVFEENIQKRHRVKTKRFKSGVLNTSDIHRVFNGKEDVFKKRAPLYPSIAFELVLDMSGSMCGSKYEEATHALSVIEYALAGLYPTKIIGFNTAGRTTHYHLIRDFKDTTKKINYSASFAKVEGPNNANRDSVIVDIAAKELSKRPEEQKILIVLSDGSPNSEYSSGLSAIEELRESVKKAYSLGIDNVIPIYFGDMSETNQDTFRHMYLNKNIIYCEFNEVTSYLKKTIKKIVLS